MRYDLVDDMGLESSALLSPCCRLAIRSFARPNTHGILKDMPPQYLGFLLPWSAAPLGASSVQALDALRICVVQVRIFHSCNIMSTLHIFSDACPVKSSQL